MSMTPQTLKALETLRRRLPEAAETLNLDFGDSFSHWCRTLDRKLLPRLNPDFPIVAAICGGGSTGKSTLFNTLAGQSASPTGGRAGLNRRVLIAASENAKGPESLMNHLGQTFGAVPRMLEKSEQLLTPGDPLYCISSALPDKVLLLDTPDIDTGAQGVYANRDLARQSLEVADLFIYIFTNATYNNRDNTDFIARMLTGVGTRPCYLVYRVYTSFDDAEVLEHAHTVTRHIYGPGTDARANVLGIFRADEDNAVAAGKAAMTLRTVASDHLNLKAALEKLDPGPLRYRLLGAMFADVVAQAAIMAAQIKALQSDLAAYSDALVAAQSQSVQAALSHFPTDRVLRRFAAIWLETDPTHIKVMRRTGRVIEWPMKTVVKTVRRFRRSKPQTKPPSTDETLNLQVEMDLLTAANQLHQKSLEARLPHKGRSVSAPAVIQSAQMELGRRPWQSVLPGILEKKTDVLSWSAQLDSELRALADDLRHRMGLMDQIRQTFAALLNVLPATAAITYILSTGDPVGAVGIKVKLTGLFGLHDLYALIAIPATAGMSKADRKQLEQLLAPLARTWLAHKISVVQTLFETQITGVLLSTLRMARKQTLELDYEIEQALKVCKA